MGIVRVGVAPLETILISPNVRENIVYLRFYVGVWHRGCFGCFGCFGGLDVDIQFYNIEYTN